MKFESLNRTVRTTRKWFVIVAGLTVLAGCVVYEPVPAPAPSTFDRSWSAALAAATGDPDKFPATNRSVNL